MHTLSQTKHSPYNVIYILVWNNIKLKLTTWLMEPMNDENGYSGTIFKNIVW